MRTVVTAILVLFSTILASAEGVEVSAPVVTYKAIAYTPDGAFYMSAHFEDAVAASDEAVAGCVEEYETLCIAGASAPLSWKIALLTCPGITGPVSGAFAPDSKEENLDPRADKVRQQLKNKKCELLWLL